MSSLIKITESTHDILIDMRYATANNFTGRPIYPIADCYIHAQALPHLEKAIHLAAELGFKLLVLDAYRPQNAQEKLWEICPDPMYITPPARGSHHTRGVAIDITLADIHGHEWDMGTPFDSFSPLSHHGAIGLCPKIVKNRYLLLGIMMSAGWDLYTNEWWHYQLFNPRDFPLIETID